MYLTLNMSFRLLVLFSVVALCFSAPLDTGNDGFDERFPEENPGLFEGDIELDGENPFSRNAIGNKKHRWPGGVVPYEISKSFSDSEQKLHKYAMKDIQIKTKNCIRFVPRNNTHKYYITLVSGGGCHSPIGFYGKNSKVTLGAGCQHKGVIIHELLHILGFYHEQSRPDRDNYVTIDFSNVRAGMEFNFMKYQPPTIDTQGFPYDYGSLMHYGKYAFAVDRRRPTIIPKKFGARIGQRNGLSDIDTKEIMRLYGCA